MILSGSYKARWVEAETNEMEGLEYGYMQKHFSSTDLLSPTIDHTIWCFSNIERLYTPHLKLKLIVHL